MQDDEMIELEEYHGEPQQINWSQRKRLHCGPNAKVARQQQPRTIQTRNDDDNIVLRLFVIAMKCSQLV